MNDEKMKMKKCGTVEQHDWDKIFCNALCVIIY